MLFSALAWQFRSRPARPGVSRGHFLFAVRGRETDPVWTSELQSTSDEAREPPGPSPLGNGRKYRVASKLVCQLLHSVTRRSSWEVSEYLAPSRRWL